jgi:hypothetical protein
MDFGHFSLDMYPWSAFRQSAQSIETGLVLHRLWSCRSLCVISSCRLREEPAPELVASSLGLDGWVKVATECNVRSYRRLEAVNTSHKLTPRSVDSSDAETLSAKFLNLACSLLGFRWFPLASGWAVFGLYEATASLFRT